MNIDHISVLFTVCGGSRIFKKEDTKSTVGMSFLGESGGMATPENFKIN